MLYSLYLKWSRRFKEWLFNTRLVKWYLFKYFGFPKEHQIFELKFTAIRYWKDKQNNLAVSREYGIPLFPPYSFYLFKDRIKRKIVGFFK